MNASLTLAVQLLASVGIGLLIGLEREWAHKEAGGRSFAIAALLGTLAWLISPAFAVAEVAVVVVMIVLVNYAALRNQQPLEITTSLALATTNILGILVGVGAFFLALSSALLITALLSWKPEMMAFIRTLTVREIRGALLLGFITAVVYPLLPVYSIDPWHLINPRGVWLTVIIVSGLSFVNYLLLRIVGTKGLRYSALLGGLVNSAAMSVLLGQEIKRDPTIAATATSNLLLADLAMIVRNGVLVVLFSWPFGWRGSLATLMVLGIMMFATIAAVFVAILRTEPKTQSVHAAMPLLSPLSFRSVLGFGFLFLTLTVVSGLGQRFFGTIGFLVVVITGALASAASSAVLVGGNIHFIGAQTAAFAMFCATVVGLVENVAIFYLLTRNRAISGRVLLFLLPITLLGTGALLLVFWR